MSDTPNEAPAAPAAPAPQPETSTTEAQAKIAITATAPSADAPAAALVARVREAISTTPITVTAAAGMSAAALQPLISWLLNGCPHPAPEGVALTIGALIIIVAHGVKKFAEPWLERRLGLPDV